MKIRMTRAVAKATGQVRYYTGTRCQKGHDSERYTSNGTCCACHLEAAIAYGQSKGNIIVHITVRSPEHAKAIRDYATLLNSTR